MAPQSKRALSHSSRLYDVLRILLNRPVDNAYSFLKDVDCELIDGAVDGGNYVLDRIACGDSDLLQF
jgi:hypothetical protein